MKLELRARQAGKTTEAIKLASKTGAYILVPNKEQARYVNQLADKLGLHIRFPVTWAELEKNRSTGFVKDLVIDNADMLLEQILPFHKIHLATWTEESPTPEGGKEGA